MDKRSPFEIDTNRYKSLLSKDQSLDKNFSEEVVEAEEIFENGTFKGLPPSSFESIRELQSKVPMTDAVKSEVSKAFNDLVQNLNQRYGLNVSFDFNSFTNSLANLTVPKNKMAAEYYLSIAYGQFRVVMYQQYLQAITLLASQILNPTYLLSESMTQEDKMDMMVKLHELMTKMNEIYEQVNIPDTEMKLEKLASDNKTTVDFKDPRVSKLIEKLENNILEK